MSAFRTVLIADDDDAVRGLIALALARGALTVVQASDGDEALALARGVRPALAVLDVQMPGPDGIAVCRALKTDPVPCTNSIIRSKLIGWRTADLRGEMLLLLAILYAVLRLLIDLALVRSRSATARDIELLALRHEVRVLRRAAKRNRWWLGDRLVLTALSRTLTRSDWGRLPVRPETLLRWHRELVRRKWAAFGRRQQMGRPALPAEARDLVRRLAAENRTWGYQRIRGELLKLGHDVSATAIRTILRRHGLPPAPRRAGLSWRAFLRAHAGTVLACDFFVVETVRLQTLYALFFIEVHTRRVVVAGCTAQPTAGWVTQQARNLAWRLGDDGVRPTLLVRDRDATFARAFDDVFRSEGVRMVRTPVRAPRANAHAERWVGTVRRECLDRMLIVGRHQLERVLREYADHYNTARPHQALGLTAPLADGQPSAATGAIMRHDRLGGLIHEYERQAA
jgi:putative transposase